MVWYVRMCVKYVDVDMVVYGLWSLYCRCIVIMDYLHVCFMIMVILKMVFRAQGSQGIFKPLRMIVTYICKVVPQLTSLGLQSFFLSGLPDITTWVLWNTYMYLYIHIINGRSLGLSGEPSHCCRKVLTTKAVNVVNIPPRPKLWLNQ